MKTGVEQGYPFPFAEAVSGVPWMCRISAARADGAWCPRERTAATHTRRTGCLLRDDMQATDLHELPLAEAGGEGTSAGTLVLPTTLDGST